MTKVGVLAYLGVAAVLYLAWRYQRVPPSIESSVAHLCRPLYARARSGADTLDVDTYTWQVSRGTWRRLPTCGELREAGKI